MFHREISVNRHTCKHNSEVKWGV